MLETTNQIVMPCKTTILNQLIARKSAIEKEQRLEGPNSRKVQELQDEYTELALELAEREISDWKRKNSHSLFLSDFSARKK